MRASVLTRDLNLVASWGVSPEELAGFTEIAEILGVHKRTVQRYIARDDFPEPLGRLARGRVWRRSDVEEWGRTHLPLPKPGRPRKHNS